ncbi:MAG: SpoVA/SpoVAEb family sporulation membrane protein [Bacilli bacterium]|nr:SpoVA/SpoVAEb family sporulation membrane protein [Bacilli bacterium]
MKSTKYNRIADNHKASKHIVNNAIIAFITGGFVGLLGEGIIELYIYYFNISRTIASSYMIITFIFVASLFTALGFFDKMVTFCKCGLIIPITGFAHSMTSAFMDYRKEGFIYGVGSNAFKLAGTVILYGVLSASLFGLIRYFIGG